MSAEYTRDILRVVVARICQTIGWHSIQTTPLDILVDILRRYLKEISKLTSNYAVQFGHTQPNLDELGLVFRDMHINITDLEEYVRYVDSIPAMEVPQYPVQKDSYLNFLKPGSREVVTRPVHIYEYLPPMLPDVEEPMETSPIIPKEESPQNVESNVFKRPADISPNELIAKRPRLIMEEEGRPTREISSVMMTTSGFLSPAREGKLPEARTPINTIDRDTPPISMSHGNSFNSEQRMERKIPKLVKDFKKVDKRKDKTSKELFKVDEIVTKKFTTMKDVVRMKALKANIANNSNNVVNPASDTPQKTTVTKTPPAGKSNKAQTKAVKAEKPSPSPQPPKPPTLPDKFMEGKLSSEPDKSKLNIFKKINKVKEDKIEKIEKVKIKEEPKTDGISLESRESSPDLIIDETENKNWDKTLSNIKQEVTIKKEPIDTPMKVIPPVEVPIKIFDVKSSPRSEKDFLYDDDLSPPGTPSTPKTPEMPTHSPPLKAEKELKRKRKDKTKIKNKTKVPKYSMSPRRNKNDTFEAELDRPKTPNDPINLVKDEAVVAPPQPPVPPPVFPFFPNYIPGPGLIPNPLFPRIPLTGGMPKHGFGQPAHISPAMPALPPFAPTVKPPPPDEVEEKPQPVTVAPEPVVKAEKPEPAVVKEKHKKDKKDKPKKKNKKDKIKNKSEKRKLKEEKKEKDKDKIKKEKKEKKKEKEREHEGSVPKLTLKIGSPRPPTPDVQMARKIMIKPVVKKEEEPPPSSPVSNVEPQVKREPSPELARISALITRPPKLKTSTTVNDMSPRHSMNLTESPTVPPTSIHKLKKSTFRAIPKIKNRDSKRAGDPEDDVSESFTNYDMQMQTPNTVPVPAPPPVAPAAFYLDNEGNKVWICPGCGGQDDGSPMIGCDDCDAWYHWVCVGIQVPPDDNEDWYCRICIVKKQETLQMDKKKKRKKKEKKEH